MRMEAAGMLADRGWGKPAQEIDFGQPEDAVTREKLREYTTEELDAMAAMIEAQAE